MTTRCGNVVGPCRWADVPLEEKELAEHGQWKTSHLPLKMLGQTLCDGSPSQDLLGKRLARGLVDPHEQRGLMQHDFVVRSVRRVD